MHKEFRLITYLYANSYKYILFELIRNCTYYLYLLCTRTNGKNNISLGYNCTKRIYKIIVFIPNRACVDNIIKHLFGSLVLL